MIKITFRDNGIGMDEKTTKNLFNPFFTTKDKGVGLGMALTHKIIEDHRGTIEVMSEQGKRKHLYFKASCYKNVKLPIKIGNQNRSLNFFSSS